MSACARIDAPPSRASLIKYVEQTVGADAAELQRVNILLDEAKIAPADCWLLFAARVGDARTVSCLLRLGADVNVPDTEGSTPLMRAISRAHTDTVRLLLEAPAVDVMLSNGTFHLLDQPMSRAPPAPLLT